MDFERHVSTHTAASLYQKTPIKGTYWVVYKVVKRVIDSYHLDKVVWSDGYFWGEYEGKRIQTHLRPEDVIHVFQ